MHKPMSYLRAIVPVAALFLAYTVWGCASKPAVLVFGALQLLLLVSAVREVMSPPASKRSQGQAKTAAVVAGVVAGFVGFLLIVWLLSLVLGLYMAYKGFRCDTLSRVATAVWLAAEVIAYMNSNSGRA